MNWHDRIPVARKRGGFTEKDRNDARRWPTCACGKSDPRIERKPDGMPVDAELSSLGLEFDEQIDGDDYDFAQIILDAIERREQEILRTMEGKV